MADNNRKLKGTYAVLTRGFLQAQIVNRRYAQAPDSDLPFDTIVYRRPEAPVIAGYMPSEVFPDALGKTKDAFPTGSQNALLDPPPVPHTNGTTTATAEFSGHGRVAIGQGISPDYGEGSDVVIVNLPHESS